MNRKLHNSLMALSTTGLLLVVGLMAATPVAGPADLYAGSAVALVDVDVPTPAISETEVDAATRRIDARAAAIDARAHAFEEEFRNAGDAQHAIALTAGFIAETATEAAVAAALAELNGEAHEAEADSEPPARETPRKRRNARSALALPYFSFARGLRGGNGS